MSSVFGEKAYVCVCMHANLIYSCIRHKMTKAIISKG